MSNRASYKSRIRPPALLAASMVVAALGAYGASPAPLGAQQDRIDSPFRWREKGFRVGLFGGYHAANRGRLEFGQGPTSVAGAKMRVRISSPLSLELGGTYGAAQRWTLDVQADGGPAIVDTVKAGWFRAEAGAQIALTGARTWNGFHPYGMIGGGFVFGVGEGASEALADQALEPYRYNIATAPHIYVGLGIEVFLGAKIGLAIEARDYLIRLSAPNGYLLATTLAIFEEAGTAAPQRSAWQHNPEFGITLWYYF